MRLNGQRSHAFMSGLFHAQGSTAKPTATKPSVAWPSVRNSIGCKIVTDRVLCCGTLRRKSRAPQSLIHGPHRSSQADPGVRAPTLQLALRPHHHILLFPNCATQNWDAYDKTWLANLNTHQAETILPCWASMNPSQHLPCKSLHTYIHIHILYIYIHYIYTHTYIYIYMYMYMPMCLCIRICTCACAYILPARKSAPRL